MPQQNPFDHFGQLNALLKKAAGWKIRSASMTAKKESTENNSLYAESPDKDP
ncbi:hypothetical protein [Azotobacter chroococcum]|uniref:hypothetical protein n=1 Tax=Azotobacter chroococcum TaxID=353 RepID=UPI000B22851D|nr:hypothetical protein [Azotobacter chroococcum]